MRRRSADFASGENNTFENGLSFVAKAKSN